MNRSLSALAVAAACLLCGCTAEPLTALTSSAAPSAPTSGAASSASEATAPGPGPTPQGAASGLTAKIDAPPVVTEAVPGRVFAVDGVLLVNKDHPLARDYVPAWSNKPNGLHPDVTAALNRLIADAKAQDTRIVLRSGYRSYASQAAIFARESKNYPPATARLYFAEAGRSEHQTGLAVDVWDGATRGFAFARTKQARWLAEHAWEYGFIIRYPEGRTDVTGYAWESWHLRYVGTALSTRFGPNSTLTLEEALGVG